MKLSIVIPCYNEVGTIRAIVDQGTYAIDEVIVREIRDGREIRDPEWHTIDKVRHKDKQGRWRYYSSKPPLLPTLLAGPYWVIKAVTGTTLASSRATIQRIGREKRLSPSPQRMKRRP